MKSLSRVQLLATPWTAAYQAPPSMGFFQARALEWGAIAFSEKLLYLTLFLSVNLSESSTNGLNRQLGGKEVLDAIRIIQPPGA